MILWNGVKLLFGFSDRGLYYFKRLLGNYAVGLSVKKTENGENLEI